MANGVGLPSAQSRRPSFARPRFVSVNPFAAPGASATSPINRRADGGRTGGAPSASELQASEPKAGEPSARYFAEQFLNEEAEGRRKRRRGVEEAEEAVEVWYIV